MEDDELELDTIGDKKIGPVPDYVGHGHDL